MNSDENINSAATADAAPGLVGRLKEVYALGNSYARLETDFWHVVKRAAEVVRAHAKATPRLKKQLTAVISAIDRLIGK